MSYIERIAAAQGHLCFYCGHRMFRHQHIDGEPTPADAITKDHITPRVYGGATTTDNLVAACRLCNNLRGEMDAEAFANLLKKWFKRDPYLWIRWHTISYEEFYELKRQCSIVYARQLCGLARRYIDYAYRHIDFLWRERHRLNVGGQKI